MENLPGIIEKKRIPIQIPIRPFLRDHIFDAMAVLPAVESMELLSASIAKVYPDYNHSSLSDINLKKFIPIPENEEYIEAFNEIEIYDNHTLSANLITIKKAKNSSITRKQEHITVRFTKDETQIKTVPQDIASYIEGIAFTVEGDDLYRELVPFGPAYHNVERAFLTDHGGAAYLNSGSPAMGEHILGSPFTLDAAFHGACAWGQRFLNFVGFPVSLKRRIVIKPTDFDGRYFCRIIPITTNSDFFTCNVWVYDDDGNIREAAEGLTMRDISRGRIQPPKWIREDVNSHDISRLESLCKSLTIIELDAMAHFAVNAFSPMEKERTEKMGEKRIRSFTGARLTCKSISRKLSGNDYTTKGEDINTVDNETQLPVCHDINSNTTINCTVSHNSRFAVAAASNDCIGIDVETISERAMKTKKFFTSETEQKLIDGSGDNKQENFIKIWTIKEAVAKACGIDLTDAWKRTEVIQLGENASYFLLDNKEESVHHKKIDSNIFSLVILKHRQFKGSSNKGKDC